VYWLRQAAAFQTADYFALADDAATVLGDDLAGQETLTMRPRSSQTLTASPPPGVGFLGVVAAYRDLNNVSWRGVASLAPNRRNVLEVRLGRFGVTIGQGGLTAQRPAPVAAR
jgi:type VI secretion system protein VasD